MSTVALAVLTASALAAIVVGLLVRRARRAAHEQFTQGLAEMGDRLDSLARELAEAVDKIREEGTRARLLESLGGKLDLDEVMMRCAEAAASLQGVAAAALTIELDGVPTVAAVGIDPDTVGATSGPPGGLPVRAVGLSYHYREGTHETGAMLSAVAVPIVVGTEGLGFLTVFGRAEEPPVAGSEFQTLESIAQHAGPAIERARRRSLRNGQTTDALTGLGSRQALHETLALEVARAHRSARRLALCVLAVDDLGEANVRLGQSAADEALGEIAAALRQTLRPGDLVFRSGGDEFAVVLPSSGRIEAEATVVRVQASLGSLPHLPGAAPSLSAGIAELKSEDDGVSLFERAERALRRAKAAGKGTAA